jgi:hypothetical protein
MQIYKDFSRHKNSSEHEDHSRYKNSSRHELILSSESILDFKSIFSTEKAPVLQNPSSIVMLARLRILKRYLLQPHLIGNCAERKLI